MASIWQVKVDKHKPNREMTFGSEIGPDSEDGPVVKSKLSDSIPHFKVAAGFNLHFSSSDGRMCNPRKLRNLKDATAQIAQFM